MWLGWGVGVGLGGEDIRGPISRDGLLPLVMCFTDQNTPPLSVERETAMMPPDASIWHHHGTSAAEAARFIARHQETLPKIDGVTGSGVQGSPGKEKDSRHFFPFPSLFAFTASPNQAQSGR